MTPNKGYQRPVEQVSWDDCQAFISKLNQLTGMRFRLPTEAEWEFAAHGGTQSRGFKYSGSDILKDVGCQAYMTPQVVMLKYSNELTIYDMTSNVWEWCSDWYGPYSSEAQTNPTGPESGSHRVIRGGCFESDPDECRVSCRNYLSPDSRYYYLGLRLCLPE